MRLLCPTAFAVLAVTSAACGPTLEPPPPAGAGSSTTDAADPSTGPGPGPGVPPTTGGTSEGTSSSTTAEPTSADGTSEDTGVLFLIPPDGGVCVGSGDEFWHCSWCDLVGQECPEGEKCVPWANDGGSIWNATRCSPVVDEPAAVGEPCTVEGSNVSGIDDCEAGALCWDVDPRTLQGTCVTFCDQYDAMPCAEGEVCVHDYPLEVNLCMALCDPLDPGSCGEGQTCHGIDGDAVCVVDTALPDGAPCSGTDQLCTADQACVRDEGLAACREGSCCTPWCDLSAPDPDAPCTVPGEVCRPYHEAGAPAGYAHVGVCGLPL